MWQNKPPDVQKHACWSPEEHAAYNQAVKMGDEEQPKNLHNHQA